MTSLSLREDKFKHESSWLALLFYYTVFNKFLLSAQRKSLNVVGHGFIHEIVLNKEIWSLEYYIIKRKLPFNIFLILYP